MMNRRTLTIAAAVVASLLVIGPVGATITEDSPDPDRPPELDTIIPKEPVPDDVLALLQETHLLTVALTGTGTGEVTSDPEGIDCGEVCSASFASDVTLTAAADEGSSFIAWSGDCTGTADTCVVTVDEARNVTAEFDLDPVVTLTAPATPSNNQTPTFAGSCTTGDGDVTVLVYSGGEADGKIRQTRTAPCTSGVYTVNATTLKAGTYTAQASQTNTAGNTGTSAAHTFLITRACPRSCR
jgi:hypothetical protein